MELVNDLIEIFKQHGISVTILAILIIILFRSKITIEYPKK